MDMLLAPCAKKTTGPARKKTVRTWKVLCMGLHEAHRRQVEETMVTFP
jgi:hypothetical protein